MRLDPAHEKARPACSKRVTEKAAFDFPAVLIDSLPGLKKPKPIRVLIGARWIIVSTPMFLPVWIVSTGFRTFEGES